MSRGGTGSSTVDLLGIAAHVIADVRGVIASLCLGCCLAPWAAPAQAGAEAPRDGAGDPPAAPALAHDEAAVVSTSSAAAGASWRDPEGPLGPLTLSFTFDVSVGTGTFVASRFADDPYYASSFGAGVGWRFTDDLTVGLDLSLGVEWTALVTPCHAASGPRPPGAPTEDCSDTNDPTGRRADLDDLLLSLSHARLFEVAGFTLSGRGSLALPTSLASRAATNLFTLGAGVSVERPVGPVTPALSIGLQKFFPTSDAPLVDGGDTGEGGIPIGRCRSIKSTACLLLAGFVPSWRLGIDLSVGVALPGDFDASLSFGYAYTGNFGRPVDARSSQRLDADGEPIVTGTGAFDSTSGGLEVGWAAREDLRVAVGVASSQPARTADNSALRFPFFDFISPANNYSAWYASLSWTP